MIIINVKAIAFDAYGTLFDVHTVAARCEKLFPGRGKEISEIWRTKQLEYTWLRSLMGRYKDFWGITRDSLVYTLKNLNLARDENILTSILDEYLHLDPHADIPEALELLRDKVDLSILSNGSPKMLNTLVKNANLQHIFSEVISVDELKIFKPFMGVYQLGPAKFAIPREEMLFISSNPWDVSAGKVFGFQVCWINRFNQQSEEFGDLDAQPDITIGKLTELVDRF